MTDREAVWRAIQAWADASSETDIELRASEVDAALDAMVRAVREECAKIADGERKNTAMLMSNPPQSSAAFNIASAIRTCPPPT